MIIAFNTGFRGDGRPADDLILDWLDRLAQLQPGHQFVLIFRTAYLRERAFAKNITPVIAGPRTKNSLLTRYWFNYKIPALIRKYRADVFVSMDGTCSLRTKVPQCLFIHDLSFLDTGSKAGFLTKITSLSLARAKTIITVSAGYRSAIAGHYKIGAGRISVIFPGTSGGLKPATQQQKELLKEKYTGGREYFLAPAGANLFNLLKAFSIFKKRQKSNMMLLVAGKTGSAFRKDLGTYRFRKEVLLLGDLPAPALAEITACAYAMVHTAIHDALAIYPLQAMQCGVPVVCSHAGNLPGLCAGAALFFNPHDLEDMAEKMMQVFKDEDGARKLVQAGKVLAGSYDPARSAGLLWQVIQNTINS